MSLAEEKKRIEAVTCRRQLTQDILYEAKLIQKKIDKLNVEYQKFVSSVCAKVCENVSLRLGDAWFEAYQKPPFQMSQSMSDYLVQITPKE